MPAGGRKMPRGSRRAMNSGVFSNACTLSRRVYEPCHAGTGGS